jgi:hypothetical protein
LEHTINGKKIADGQMVHYTTPGGAKREALVKRLHPVVYRADIQTKNDAGNDVFLENVPFDESGLHSWNHIPEDVAAETQTGNSEEVPADDIEEPKKRK